MESKVVPMPGSVVDQLVCSDADEVFGTGNLHVERMSDTLFWARIYANGDQDVVMWFEVVDGRLNLRTENDI